MSSICSNSSQRQSNANNVSNISYYPQISMVSYIKVSSEDDASNMIVKSTKDDVALSNIVSSHYHYNLK